MGNAFKIGRASGIDIKVHWAFFLLPAVVAFIAYQATGSAISALISIGFIMGLFVFVVLHEFGHSVAAQRLGIEVQDITLLPIGGVARMKTIPEKPSDEIKIAVAGPLVNVVLAPVLFAAAYLLGAELFTLANPLLGQVDSFGQVLAYLGFLNVVLAVFNMIPAFPMDGGRVLRGLLASRFGAVKATDISSTIGQVFAVGAFLFGVFYVLPFLILISVFVFFGASGEAQMVRQRETMRGLTVSDVMGTKRRTETLSPYNNFGQVLDAVLHGYQADFPVVEEDGRLVGIITRSEIMSAARSQDRFLNVRELMKTDFPTVSPDADLFKDGQRLLQESGLRALPVIVDGELAGMLTTDDVSQASLLRQLPK